MDDSDASEGGYEAMEVEDEVPLEHEDPEDEDAEMEIPDIPSDPLALDFLDDETTRLAAGLGSQDEGEILVALSEMQRAVRGREGEKVIVSYVLASPQCAELISIWQAGASSATAVPLMQLLYHMLKHPLGKVGGHVKDRDTDSHRRLMTVKLRLDKLARSIVRNRMRDVYSHLSSSQKSRQNAALLLLSAMVLRGRAIGTEIATTFDFTLEALRKLANPPKQGMLKHKGEGQQGMLLKQPTRCSFVEFAMSFLEIGDPGLLRWILQKRPLIAGVLHSISKDAEVTMVQVLRLLQERVMAPEFMVPRGLQSVLFGDVSLEQLARISADNTLEVAGELAHEIMLELCTNPSHGLCPESTEMWEGPTSKTGAHGGGQARLLRLMNRLKVTEVDRHRDLLLATGQGRPKLAAAYLASIPLSLEPRVSPAWFNAMSLVSKLIPVANQPPPFSSLAAKGVEAPPHDGPLIRSTLMSLLPAALSRVALNRGLLHVDYMVKHACLRVLHESLVSLKRLLEAVGAAAAACSEANHGSARSNDHLVESFISTERTREGDSRKKDWLGLLQVIQDTMRAHLPDPNTLLGIISSLKSSITGGLGASLRSKERTPVSAKKRKRFDSSLGDGPVEQQTLFSNNYDYERTIVLLWGSEAIVDAGQKEDGEILLYSKVLEVLAAFQRTLPIALADTGFDAFKLLPDNPISMPGLQQNALTTLLLAVTGSTSTAASDQSRWFVGEIASGGSACKRLRPLLLLMLNTDLKDVSEAAYLIAYRIMISTGAFDVNPYEVNLWLDALVSWKVVKGRKQVAPESKEIGRREAFAHGTVHASVIDFLAEAIGSIGQNIYRYLDRLHSILARFTLEENVSESSLQYMIPQDVNAPEFGSFVICTLETCFRLMQAKSKCVAERSAVATYVASVFDALLKYQIYPQALAAIIYTELSTEFASLSQQVEENAGPMLYEWYSVQTVLRSSEQLLFSAKGAGTICNVHTFDQAQNPEAGKLHAVLKAVKKNKEADIEALRSLLLVLPVQELVDNFPSLMTACTDDFEGGMSILVTLLGVHHNLLYEVSRAWADLYSLALKLAGGDKHIGVEKLGVENLKASATKSGFSPRIREANGLCSLLLMCPFSVLFSSAVYCNQGNLLTDQAFSNLLQAALLEIPQQNRSSAMRMVVSGVTHVFSLSSKGVDVGSSLATCFALLYSFVSSIHLELLGGNSSGLGGEENENPILAYKHMIIDLLNHPALYNLFLTSNTLPTAPCPHMNDLRRDKTDERICDTSLKRVLASAASSVNAIDGHILVLLTRILESMEILCKINVSSLLSESVQVLQERAFQACELFSRKAVTIVQEEMEQSSSIGVVASPSLFAVSVLIPFTDIPSSVNFLLSLLAVKNRKVKRSKQSAAPHLLGLHLATVFIVSSSRGNGGHLSQMQHSANWDHQSAKDSQLIFDLYQNVLEQVIDNPSMVADLCLLSFLQVVNPKVSVHQKSGNSLFRFNKVRFADFARCTPLSVLRHCVSHPNKVTGSIATLLVKTSSVHLLELGWLVAHGTGDRSQGILSRSHLNLAGKVLMCRTGSQKKDLELSDQDLLLLLPAVQVYFEGISGTENAEEKDIAKHIAAVYGNYLAKQLKSWYKFVSKEAIGEWYVSKGSPGYTSVEHYHAPGMLFEYCYHSPLGQVVRMLESCHSLHPLSGKLQNRLFKSMLPKDKASLVLLDGQKTAEEDLRRLVCEATAKIGILRHLLVSGLKLEPSEVEEAQVVKEDAGKQLELPAAFEKDSTAIQMFLSSLVYTLGSLYKGGGINWKDETASTQPALEAKPERAHWLHFLEEKLLAQVTHFAEEMVSLSVDLSNFIPVYRYSLAIFLGYRYGEPLAMKAVRYLTIVFLQCLQEMKIIEEQSIDINPLDLLIAHSKFLPSILARDSRRMQIPHLSGKHAGKGTALNSLPSVLLLVGSPLIDHGEEVEENKMIVSNIASSVGTASSPAQFPTKAWVSGDVRDQERLELVKLLRIFVALRLKQSTLEITTVDPLWNTSADPLPLEQILSILLASYGATMTEVDKEIFTLMHEIESNGGPGFPGLSGLDYLWGEAALKRRKAKSDQVASSATGLEDQDNVAELRRQTFKEDLLIDPRRCGLTVLFFPAKRPLGVPGVGQFQLANQHKDRGKETQERSLSDIERDLRAAAYDPAFILPFAVHGLSTGCISAEEFVRLGLLGVSFASISSADENMRKYGYEVLAKYYALLESCPSFKGRTQIRLLMTYVKNAVSDAWQKLPLVLSVFAAESSCILMNPDNHHYLSINRFLLRAPSLDMENIPLFQIMFASGSLQYRSDRLWMLRLLAAGLGSSLDSHMYRRKFVLELLMSFHDSAMADAFTRKWVMQVLYQAANVRSCSQYLVEHTGLLSWLASVAINDCDGPMGPHENGNDGQLASMSLKVIESIMSWGVVQKHFLSEGTEEVTKVALMFHRFLVRNSVPLYQKIFAGPTINIMTMVLRMSHRRKKHQTHFTLNLVGVIEVIHWIESGMVLTKSLVHMEDKIKALKMILHSSPPPAITTKDKVHLYEVANWAAPLALEAEMESVEKDDYSNGKHSGNKTTSHETIRQKLLRWLAAGLILGDVSESSSSTSGREKFITCLSVVSTSKEKEPTNEELGIQVNEKLARLLLSLQQGHVNVQAEVPSLVTVVCALALLTRYKAGMNGDDDDFQKSSEKIKNVLELLLAELPCPEETNPSWMWSFSGPWTVRGTRSPDENDAVEARYVSEVSSTILVLLQQLWSNRHTSFVSYLRKLEGFLSADDFSFQGDHTDSSRDKDHMKLGLLQEKFRCALQKISLIDQDET